MIGRTAPVAVDLQQGILGMLNQQDSEELVAKNIELADAFHAANLLVIWVNATGLPAWSPPPTVPTTKASISSQLPTP